jgi:hypothetical protein
MSSLEEQVVAALEAADRPLDDDALPILLGVRRSTSYADAWQQLAGSIGTLLRAARSPTGWFVGSRLRRVGFHPPPVLPRRGHSFRKTK